MFKNRCYKKEMLDDFIVSGKTLENNLHSFSLVNRFLGGYSTVKNALIKILEKNPQQTPKPLRIADLGCGGGDTLRFIAKWAQKKSFHCYLFGIDANPACIDFSIKNSQHYENIFYQNLNIFEIDFQQYNFDIIMMNTVCHHFDDEQIIQLLTLIKNQSAAMIINDLHRHWLAYYGVKVLTYIFNCSPVEKNDGPLSVLKAFSRKELESLLKKADIQHYQIKWRWAFRYQIVIYD